MKFRCLVVCVSVTLACASGSVHAYSVKSYQAFGASRIEACSTATKSALSPTEESAHGRLTKVSACQCSKETDSKGSGQWRCLVETVHAN